MWPSTLRVLSHLSLLTPPAYVGRERARSLGGGMTILDRKEMRLGEVKPKVTQLISGAAERAISASGAPVASRA